MRQLVCRRHEEEERENHQLLTYSHLCPTSAPATYSLDPTVAYIEPTLLPKFTDEAPIKFDFAVCDSLNLVELTYFVAVKCGTVLVHVMVDVMVE